MLAGLEWDWFELGGRTDLTTNARTYFSLDRSRVRVTLDSSLRRFIVRPVFWSLNLYESYDSDPLADLEKSDFGVTVTIGSTA